MAAFYNNEDEELRKQLSHLNSRKPVGTGGEEVLRISDLSDSEEDDLFNEKKRRKKAKQQAKKVRRVCQHPLCKLISSAMYWNSFC